MGSPPRKDRHGVARGCLAVPCWESSIVPPIPRSIVAPSTAESGAVRPVIAGFYPDPSICRVGEDYYLANSSFEYVPGIPIWHSRDLVTWAQVANAFGAGSHLDDGSIGPGRGVFAPTLRHRGDTWYLITTRVDHEPPGQTLVTASDPAGPWSAPVTIPALEGIDPD
ncbi:MAG: glycoside hydrolase family 43 protein, partial [Demequinaceae bacterium]|nr:glycoside hydrolase family 43 protein [Demequinaceae bacterium]